jgi:hypothetical protein
LGAVAYGTMVGTALVAGYRCQKLLSRGSALSEVQSEPVPGVALPDPHLLIEAALASVVVAFLHGLYEPLYSSRAVLLLFVPFGMLVAAIRAVGASAIQQPNEVRSSRRFGDLVPHFLALVIAGLLGALLVIVSIGLGDGSRNPWARVRSAWYANLGAVAQARVELATYDPRHFNDPTIDQVRRQEDLTVADLLFAQALKANPNNVTANQRATALALSRGQYEEALVLAQRLWDAGARDRVTRLLYGDALVAAGRPDEAVSVVQGLLFAQARLLGQAWSRYHLSGDAEREAWARDAARQVYE